MMLWGGQTVSEMGSAITLLALPLTAVVVLHATTFQVGLLIGAASLGGVAGGVLSGRLSRRIGSARLIWFSLLVLGLPRLIAPLAEPGWRVWVFVAGLAVAWFSGMVYNVAQVSYRQAICPPRLLGRMNAAVRWVVWGTLPLGGLLGGVLGTVLGVRPTLWIGFAGSWAAGWWVFFSPLRGMRDF
jgi:MFS family permease